MKSQVLESRATAVEVWGPFVRLFHWSLVAGVLLNQLVLEEGEAPHRWVGYAVAALVLVWLVWGFVGSRHARFADFFPTPARLCEQLRMLRWGRAPAYVATVRWAR